MSVKKFCLWKEEVEISDGLSAQDISAVTLSSIKLEVKINVIKLFQVQMKKIG